MSSDRNNLVFIITGHKKSSMVNQLGDIPNLGLAAEVGAFYRWPGKSEWETSPHLTTLNWKQITIAALREYTDRTMGSYIEERDATVLWKFHDAETEYGNLQADELIVYLEKVLRPWETSIIKYDHSRSIEVRCKSMSKGHATSYIYNNFKRALGKLYHSKPKPFLIACGNDKSDERMYRALDRATEWPGNTYTVSVGIKPSNARYYVRDHSQIMWLLDVMQGCKYWMDHATDRPNAATSPVPVDISQYALPHNVAPADSDDGSDFFTKTGVLGGGGPMLPRRTSRLPVLSKLPHRLPVPAKERTTVRVPTDSPERKDDSEAQSG